MGIIAPVTDGRVINTQTAANENAKSKASSTLGKNDFLQLLVAQMKYQDPLEPTSNTEYISQFATFSELEEMQNMSGTMNLTRASSLVGEEVVIKSVSTGTGESNFVRGKVDYVQLENGKALLSINDQLYHLEDVYSVADSKYLEAHDTAVKFMNTVKRLPTVASVTLENEGTINLLNEVYTAMSEYGRSFVSKETIVLLQAYGDKIKELKLGE